MTMLTAARIADLFRALDAELRRTGTIGEVVICGGAVMCLVFQARRATKDIDAIFEPTRQIRDAAKKVALRFGLTEEWLNDAAKAFFHADPPREVVLDFPNLRVWAPTARYMLAMKCVSARFDSHDLDDVKFLIELLELKSPADVFRIIEDYYPRRHIPPKTQFMVEELLVDTNSGNSRQQQSTDGN
jgi:hypothetical protein